MPVRVNFPWNLPFLSRSPRSPPRFLSPSLSLSFRRDDSPQRGRASRPEPRCPPPNARAAAGAGAGAEGRAGSCPSATCQERRRLTSALEQFIGTQKRRGKGSCFGISFQHLLCSSHSQRVWHYSGSVGNIYFFSFLPPPPLPQTDEQRNREPHSLAASCDDSSF